MTYKLIFKEGVEKDLAKLSTYQEMIVLRQFVKLQHAPQLGTPLGNKAEYNLSGCKKIYVDKKKIRIVYRVIDDEIIVEVIVVGKRDDMKVYGEASKRLK